MCVCACVCVCVCVCVRACAFGCACARCSRRREIQNLQANTPRTRLPCYELPLYKTGSTYGPRLTEIPSRERGRAWFSVSSLRPTADIYALLVASKCTRVWRVVLAIVRIMHWRHAVTSHSALVGERHASLSGAIDRRILATASFATFLLLSPSLPPLPPLESNHASSSSSSSSSLFSLTSPFLPSIPLIPHSFLKMAPLPQAPSNRRSPKTLTTFLSGATSGCVSTLCLQPLDVVKTRMQMSAAYNRSVHLHSALTIQPNASALDTLRGIVRQDSVLGLWRGVTPSVLRNTMGVGVYFMSLNTLTARLSSPDGSLSDAATVASGAGARSIAVILLCPLSVIKTRMETVEYSKIYTGIFNAFTTIARQEGHRALFSGLLPAIIRDAPFSAMYMLIYLRTKEALGNALGIKDNRSSIVRNAAQSNQSATSGASSPSPSASTTAASSHPDPSDRVTIRVVNFTSGAFGGGLATLLTQPQDVVKTRMQLSQKSLDGTPTRYSSVFEATRRVFNEEGFYGFFRGSSPRFLKRILGSAITWMIFEECNNFYAALLNKDKNDNR